MPSEKTGLIVCLGMNGLFGKIFFSNYPVLLEESCLIAQLIDFYLSVFIIL